MARKSIPETPADANKLCSRCHRLLHQTNFHRDAHSRDGRRGWCRQCVSEQDAHYNRRVGKRPLSAEQKAYRQTNAFKSRRKIRRSMPVNAANERAYRLSSHGSALARAATRRFRQTENGKLSNRVQAHRYRARNAAIPGQHSAGDIIKLITRSSRCYICGKRFTKTRPPTIDHVLALNTLLATNDPSNLALAHGTCNSSKRDRRENPLTGQGILL